MSATEVTQGQWMQLLQKLQNITPKYYIGSDEVTKEEWIKFWNPAITTKSEYKVFLSKVKNTETSVAFGNGRIKMDASMLEGRIITQVEDILRDVANKWEQKGDDLPAYSVNQERFGPNQAQCKWFCRILSALEGKHYRLPTEAEWEYACRAGSKTRFASGDSERDLEDLAWYLNNSGGRLHAVATKKPNAWGLYDMHGNVAEWVEDISACGPGTYGGHIPRPYETSQNADPIRRDDLDPNWQDPYHVTANTIEPIFRGGDVYSSSEYCRAAARWANKTDEERSYFMMFGFRVVLDSNSK